MTTRYGFKFRRIVAALLAAALPLASLHADVGSSMDSFLNDVGGAAQVNGPTAFQGQSAGYYSLGNVWTRFPQKTTNIANLQLPRARAGCGGIDIFAGSFSFINASEIVAMLSGAANLLASAGPNLTTPRRHGLSLPAERRTPLPMTFHYASKPHPNWMRSPRSC